MKPKPQSRRRPAGGFTLTELLVVILIIAVLAALSMVGVRQFRGAADKVAATRSISQLQIANALYAADNGGRYVPVFTRDDENVLTSMWARNKSFLKYVVGDDVVEKTKNAYAIPDNLLDPIVTRAKKPEYDMYSSNFGYNNEGFSGPGTGYNTPGAHNAWHVSQVVSPERSCAFITATDWFARHSGRSLWKGDAAVEGRTNDGKIAYRHKGGKALVVYYDGHVGEMSMKEIESLDNISDPKMKGRNNIFWNPDGK